MEPPVGNLRACFLSPGFVDSIKRDVESLRRGKSNRGVRLPHRITHMFCLVSNIFRIEQPHFVAGVYIYERGC